MPRVLSLSSVSTCALVEPIQYHNFKHHLHADKSLIYISSPDFSLDPRPINKMPYTTSLPDIELHMIRTKLLTSPPKPVPLLGISQLHKWWWIFSGSQATMPGFLFSHPLSNLSANPVSVTPHLVTSLLLFPCCLRSPPSQTWILQEFPHCTLCFPLDVLSSVHHTYKYKSDPIDPPRFASHP